VGLAHRVVLFLDWRLLHFVLVLALALSRGHTSERFFGMAETRRSVWRNELPC
jgi:hypothetical protein